MAKLAPLLKKLRDGAVIDQLALPSLMGWKGVLVLAKRRVQALKKFPVRVGKSSLWHFGSDLTLEQKDQHVHSKKSIHLIDKRGRPLLIPEGVFYLYIRSVSDIYKGPDFFFRKMEVEIQLEMIETEEKKRTLRSTGDKFQPAEFRNKPPTT